MDIHRLPDSIDVLREAATLAAQYLGEASPVALQNRLFLGYAELSAVTLTPPGSFSRRHSMEPDRNTSEPADIEARNTRRCQPLRWREMLNLGEARASLPGELS